MNYSAAFARFLIDPDYPSSGIGDDHVISSVARERRRISLDGMHLDWQDKWRKINFYTLKRK